MDSLNQLQFEILSPAFVFISCLMILGIPGNIVCILVYGLQLKSTTGRYAIITLAACDIINCAMSIPVELYIMTRYWSFDNAALCKMSRFVTYAMNNSSGLILVAIAFERYRTICTPHKPKITKQCIKIMCVVLVICGIILALPSLWIYGIKTITLPQNGLIKGQNNTFERSISANGTYDNDYWIYNYTKHTDDINDLNFSNKSMDSVMRITTKICLIDDQIKSPLVGYGMIGFVTLAGIGVLFILVLIYGQIAWKIRKLRALIDTKSKTERAMRSAKKKQVTFMLFLITLAFEFNYIPFIIITNLRFFNPEWYGNQSKAGKMLYHVFLRSYLINCAINPFIYCVSSPQFRSALFRLHKRIRNTTSFAESELQTR